MVVLDLAKKGRRGAGHNSASDRYHRCSVADDKGFTNRREAANLRG
jgi:hypothetical protein